MNRHADTLSFVNTFHQVFVIGIGVPDEKIKALRPVLIKEEFKELQDAITMGNRVLILDALCDLQYVVDGTYIAFEINKPVLMALPTDVYHEDDNEALLLGMCDRINVLTYCLTTNERRSADILYAAASLTSLQHNLDRLITRLGFEHTFFDAFCEVHRSNMSKAGPDGKPVLREDGKALKGPNYTPPQLERFCL